MNTFEKADASHFLGHWIGIIFISLFGLGCEEGSPAKQNASRSESLLATTDQQTDIKSEDSHKNDKSPGPKKVEIGRNVFLEVQGEKRRVIVEAEVCLREGMLEHLMCRQRTKEHEAILTADVDARDIHKALIVAKATRGTTVRYKDDGTVDPPTGTKIKVTLTYKDKNKTITVPGRDWVRDFKTKKSLDVDWVFAGSQFLENPLEKDKPPLYAANAGDVICVSNFEGAMLDLPINSSKNNAELEFEAFTERIPPVGTAVTVILEPVLEEKKEKDPFKERPENQKEKKIESKIKP
jgi:hypothetical protein